MNIAKKNIMNRVQVDIGDRIKYRVNFLLSNNIKGRKEFQDMLTQNVFPRQLSILTIFLIFFWILAFAIACVENIYEKGKLTI